MPKGSKICTKCQAVCGPRSSNCPTCGAGFIVKGIQQPDLVVGEKVEIEQEENEEEKKQRKILLSLFQPIIADDPKGYYTNLKMWESNCGKYQLQRFDKFMGVISHGGKKYKLLEVREDGSTAVPYGKYRFKTYKAAVANYLKRIKGKNVLSKTEKTKHRTVKRRKRRSLSGTS